MGKLLAILFIFSCHICFAQTVLTDSSLLIKPGFNKGDVKIYLVNQKSTIESSPLFPVKAEHDFKITFTIIDTTSGYTIHYKADLLETTSKRYVSESVKAQLIDGLSLTYKLNKDGWLIALPDYRREQLRVIKKLDSIIGTDELKRDDKIIVTMIRKNLQKNDGLETCLAPLLLFNDIFTKPVFRYHKDYHPMSIMNIFYQPQIPGTAILELQREKGQFSSSIVTLDFVANRDSAAKYMEPRYHEAYYAIKGKPMKSSINEMKITHNREYDVSHPSGTPLSISDKHVEFYLQRSVTKTTMKLLSE
jgi:hypothetical protein